MPKPLIIIFFLVFSLNASEVKDLFQNIQKEEILKSINDYSLNDFTIAYLNVVDRLKEEKNFNAMYRITEAETIRLLAYNYKNMLKAIASNESNFIYRVGLYDKNDVSFFQINIRDHLWNLSKLNHFTKMNLTRQKLIDDHELAGKVALHILIYNIAIHSNFYKYNPKEKDICKLIGTYNNPINLDLSYISKAKSFLASL